MQSAGILLPLFILTISPTTKSSPLIYFSTPSLITLVIGGIIFLNCLITLLVFLYEKYSKKAFNKIIKSNAIESTKLLD